MESNNMNTESVSMGKKKMKRERKRSTEIAFISNKRSRLVTYSKRRAGLFKKATEAYLLTGNSVIILGFSPSGRPFSFSTSHPSPASLHAFLDSYLAGDTSTSSPEVKRPADEVEKSECPSLEELMAEKRQLQEARLRVLARLEKLEENKVVCQSYRTKNIAAVQERLSRPPSLKCKYSERNIPRQDLGSSSTSGGLRQSSCQTAVTENGVVQERPFPRPVIKCMEEEVGEYWEDYDPALFSSSVVWPPSSPLLQDEDNASLFHTDFDDLLNVVPGTIFS